ncbi:NADH:flavin oxidoreductase/NADH oxidase [Caballeronia calidae]|uniref:NADH:flavin oxidoreductase/NADH oxidase n=1 Tax=Caballeronia calidae TaxID=1777139 RepID=A0A158EC40_9BURK|nr:alkene reductase [Caballeronia calidae]SAL04408.1 NADH:flavin oxidoreductase/NADH oxidase [Caballeronia calidae]
MPTLLDRIQIGDLDLDNRVVMAPMTRSRAGECDIPTDLNGQYYAQRATAGLIVSEATNVSRWSSAFERAPGIYTDAQVQGWKSIVNQIHDAGGKIFLQLWHSGRISSFALLGGHEPLSPSGVNDDLEKLQVWAQLANGAYTKIHATPSRAMTRDEIKHVVREYRLAAEHAWSVGFDGVEIHAANGYLPHQFLSPTINRRDDEYGGSAENRARFLKEIIDNVGEVMPVSRVGVRISPFAHYNNVRDPDPASTYSYVAEMLERFKVGYTHLADTNGWAGAPDLPAILDIVRPRFSGTLIANGGISIEQAKQLLNKGQIDLVAFGRLYISNPDLVGRIRHDAPLSDSEPRGWYGGNEAGYTDYPPHA